jgi:glucose-6-phosphate 1-dehydrogenase
MTAARSDALVFFGSTGDLAFKQIYPALEALVRAGRLDMPIVATGRKELPIEQLRARAKESLTAAKVAPGKSVDKLLEQLRYVAVDYDKPESFDGIREAVGGARRPVHYVALPPEVFESVAKNLSKAGLAKDARLVLEKPFGHDSASAKALSKALHAYFSEEAIFRVDHFLGKEPVENIVYFRAANPLVENSWSAAHVESIQITMAEKFGVKGRAKFYDSVGAIRDVVQNHLLQIVACLTMDLPAEKGHVALRDARTRLLAQVKPVEKSDLVRGQVRGYTEEESVEKGSTTETYAALRVGIDSLRWKGMPIFIRTGKSLTSTVTEAVVRFKVGPAVLDDEQAPAPNHLRFRISPETIVALGANVKKPGEAAAGEPVELELRRESKAEMKAYERLLGDAIDGDATLFATKDAVEESWRIIDPILGNASPVSTYEPGSWGPAEASRVAPAGGWLEPR